MKKPCAKLLHQTWNAKIYNVTRFGGPLKVPVSENVDPVNDKILDESVDQKKFWDTKYIKGTCSIYESSAVIYEDAFSRKCQNI